MWSQSESTLHIFPSVRNLTQVFKSLLGKFWNMHPQLCGCLGMQSPKTWKQCSRSIGNTTTNLKGKALCLDARGNIQYRTRSGNEKGNPGYFASILAHISVTKRGLSFPHTPPCSQKKHKLTEWACAGLGLKVEPCMRHPGSLKRLM